MTFAVEIIYIIYGLFNPVVYDTTYMAGFQVLTAAGIMFTVVFWDILPCKMIVDRRFRGACCLRHQGDE
jgi:hypothetical protein